LPMFKEILHNIAKHSRAKRVTINVKVTSQRFQISIQDDGIGFDVAKVRRGNGLKNLRRRAGDLRATLEIQSQPGEGTRFTLAAPIT
jgi:signal transduction histidine kinase